MDETNSPKRQLENYKTNRRSYLLGAGSIVGALGLLGSTGTVNAASEFEEIVVSPGETYTARLNDGDVLENVLIDISADGARYDISASGSDWIIRNVGIQGHLEDTGSNEDPFRARVTDPEGTGIIRNVCLDVTTRTANNPGEHHGETGIYVWRDHAGTIEIDGAYIQNFPDNGIYASSPGHDASDARGGDVRVSNAYVRDCNTSGIRLGTDGSSIENSVIRGGYHRGVWVFYNHPEIVDSDIRTNASDIAMGDSNYDASAYAEVTMTNSRWETETAHGDATTANIHGSSVGNPRDRIPNGCPTTAEEAASGGASGGDGEAGDGGSDEPVIPEGDFELAASADGELAEYLIELDAANVEPADGADTHDHEFQDRAFERNGLWYVHGFTGGGSEYYAVESGEILRVGSLQGTAQFTADGTALDHDAFETIESIPDENEQEETVHKLEVAGQFEYRVEVDGEIRPAEEHARWLAEGEAYGDDWAEWWLSGSDEARTIWEYTGEITSIEITDYGGETELRTLAVDGQELDHDKYVDTGPHRLEVAGQFEYRVEVDGEIRPAEEHARWLAEGEAYGDDWAEWWLSGSDEARTTWIFTGDITSLDLVDYDGATEVRTVAIDGKSIDPSDY